MIIFNKRYWLLSLLIFMGSCAEETEDPELITSRYFPLEIGSFMEYSVEETIYFGENDFETENYYYKDELVDFYLDEVNELVYLFHRKKSTDRNEWSNEEVYTANFTQNRIIRKFNNQQEVILVYPAILDFNWNGNAYNNDGEEQYIIESIGSYILNEFAFADAVKVRKSEEDDLITLRNNKYEVFANNIGMVESYYEVFQYCSRNDCLGEQIIQEGRFTHMRLINYGEF
ncbi:hypothetical protein [uncultured Cyclobacterium sp.]|uniref:hypothetical protein n=1 Tax=uncultured Cyclobacterium sp. TaxID=453820 RepID=UPI0030EC40BB